MHDLETSVPPPHACAPSCTYIFLLLSCSGESLGKQGLCSARTSLSVNFFPRPYISASSVTFPFVCTHGYDTFHQKVLPQFTSAPSKAESQPTIITPMSNYCHLTFPTKTIDFMPQLQLEKRPSPVPGPRPERSCPALPSPLSTRVAPLVEGPTV